MNDEQKDVIFRGHVEDCLADFKRRMEEAVPPFTKGASAARVPMAEFCGVTEHNTARWFGGKVMPLGEPQIRLMCYFSMVGYQVIELDRMKQVNRQLAELVGYGVFSTRKAAELLGLKNPTDITQIMKGSRGLSDEKEKLLWDICKSHKDQLAAAKETAKAKFWPTFMVAPEDPPKKKSVPVEPKLVKPVVASPSLHSRLMETLDDLLTQHPLDSLTDAELVAALPQVPVLLRLSSRMSALAARLIEFQRTG